MPDDGFSSAVLEYEHSGTHYEMVQDVLTLDCRNLSLGHNDQEHRAVEWLRRARVSITSSASR